MVNWNDSTKYRLLLAIISAMDVKAPDWAVVAQKMGEDYTPEAVRQQYQKIKRNCNTELASSDGASAPATPHKRGSKAANGDTPAKATTGKRGKARADSAEDDDAESPTKKVKKENAQAKSAFKTEDGGENGGDFKTDVIYA